MGSSVPERKKETASCFQVIKQNSVTSGFETCFVVGLQHQRRWGICVHVSNQDWVTKKCKPPLIHGMIIAACEQKRVGIMLICMIISCLPFGRLRKRGSALLSALALRRYLLGARQTKHVQHPSLHAFIPNVIEYLSGATRNPGLPLKSSFNVMLVNFNDVNVNVNVSITIIWPNSFMNKNRLLLHFYHTMPGTWSVLPSTSMIDSVTGLRHAKSSRAPDYITNGCGPPMQTTSAHGHRSCPSVKTRPLTATGGPSQTSAMPCHTMPFE